MRDQDWAMKLHHEGGGFWTGIILEGKEARIWPEERWPCTSAGAIFAMYHASKLVIEGVNPTF